MAVSGVLPSGAGSRSTATAADETRMEGVAGDRCALDGSPCVHAGRINSGRYTESKIGPGAERRCRARERARRLGTIDMARRRLRGAA